MPDMLTVTALEIGDPLCFFILMETGDASVHDRFYSFMFRSSSVPSARSITR